MKVKLFNAHKFESPKKFSIFSIVVYDKKNDVVVLPGLVGEYIQFWLFIARLYANARISKDLGEFIKLYSTFFDGLPPAFFPD